MIKRIDSIDFAKGVGIIAVTLGHILIRFSIRNSLYLWLYSFEIPLFFIVSGILQSKMDLVNSTWRSYLHKQAITIIYPYFSFSLIVILLHIVEALIMKESVKACVLRDTLYSLSGMGIGALWFLPTLFFANICANGIIRHIKPGGVLLI